MKKKVLVLNQDYSPLMVTTVQRGFILTFLGKAEMVNSANGSMLHSVSQSFPLPAVIRLHKYINLPYRGVVLTRQNIFKRDGMTCLYCDSKRDLTLDHVIPRSKGGKSSWTNLATACKKCNARKGDSTPEQAEMKLRTIPYKPSFLVFLKNFSGALCEEWQPFLEKTKK